MSLPALPQFELAPESLDELRRCFERELRHKRAFIPGCFTAEEQQLCLFVLVRPAGLRFEIEAKVVYAKRDEPFAGVGLELVGLSGAKNTELLAFLNAPEPMNALPSSVESRPGSEPLESTEPSSSAETTPIGASNARRPKNLYERIRELSLRERDQVARDGALSERVALERTFGSSIWEALLQNPQLTHPEVAHIAKNGTLSVPLIANIVANSSWLQSGEVRRALLSNPRLNGAHLERVLRAMPRWDLKQLAQLSSARQQVRLAAKKLLGE